MPALSQYTNVGATAVEVLKAKGFQVWFDQETDLYCAEKDGWDFFGDDPCGLLGVVAIYEHVRPSDFKEYWWKLATGSGYDEVPREPVPYTSVTRRRNERR